MYHINWNNNGLRASLTKRKKSWGSRLLLCVSSTCTFSLSLFSPSNWSPLTIVCFSSSKVSPSAYDGHMEPPPPSALIKAHIYTPPLSLCPFISLFISPLYVFFKTLYVTFHIFSFNLSSPFMPISCTIYTLIVSTFFVYISRTAGYHGWGAFRNYPGRSSLQALNRSERSTSSNSPQNCGRTRLSHETIGVNVR